MLTGVQGALGMLKQLLLKAFSFFKFYFILLTKRHNFLSVEYRNSAHDEVL